MEINLGDEVEVNFKAEVFSYNNISGYGIRLPDGKSYYLKGNILPHIKVVRKPFQFGEKLRLKNEGIDMDKNDIRVVIENEKKGMVSVAAPDGMIYRASPVQLYERF